MRTDVRIIAEKGRLPRLRCTGSLQGRITDTDTVHLVGVAASPLGGDEISVRIEVGEGAILRVRSVAAAVALPGRENLRSFATWDCAVAGLLDLDPAPTIVAANASHHSHVTVRGSVGVGLRLRERVQIGRTGESSGFWSGQFDADIGATPLLRHRIELGAGSVTDDELGRPLALISELRYPATGSIEQLPTGGTLLSLAGDATLLTWQGQRLPPD
ncbi:Putative urease accessory protein (UreH?) [Mycobacteroides abscessus subsp. bolletii]|uniref:Urease accessory protein UreD n=1 Tax=Mycobacteroides abscessus subsp. bolletii TaxID=319705 RepID=A0A9Q7WII1_9MYCO|nr:urease accessory protein UreD [Mycobacteroides abscessus]AMU21306.1 urease accessory protein UreD [Mycobacteroides abscessus]MBN7304391.1 urease accessory protein UreD [Mycobacteroides abscessus subsp. bolletii]MDO2971087.1 urease accessory protein UreD [Mycobacteroides abscessus subsp. bolletii]MDO3070974.1 urease accessory protein UreD [Mycobacteroides abscessus subsp. bolletii]MDO3078471.1 urease accessory protein UreD [Mycobacteroides abscessus subsp. bolletii]